MIIKSVYRMNNRVDIGKRIKKLRLENNFSQTHIAEILFISQAAYSLIENSQNGIVSDHIIKLSRLYNVSTDFILTGEKNYIKIGRDTGFIPLFRTSVHQKILDSIENEKLIDIKDWFRVPGFDPTKDQTMFQVEGEGMAPTIFPGDVLICQVHSDYDKVLDGSAVVIITVDGVKVKRLKKHEDVEYFLAENDSDLHRPGEKLKKKDIKHMLMIRGKISNVLISNQNIEGKAKMQSLEDSIEVLKNELFNMNQKLNALTEAKK